MILNIIILWILILILSGTIWCLYKWYKQEQKEQDERILQLEKRIEEYKKEIKEDSKKENIKIYDNLTMNNQDIGRITKEINKLKNKRENEKK